MWFNFWIEPCARGDNRIRPPAPAAFGTGPGASTRLPAKSSYPHRRERTVLRDARPLRAALSHGANRTISGPLIFSMTWADAGSIRQTLSFQRRAGGASRCLMRGMDATRNLAPPLDKLAARARKPRRHDTGLPSREVLSGFLSKLDLEWDFAAICGSRCRAEDNDPQAPMARYFVIHDTSGPNFGRRSFPDEIDVDSQDQQPYEFQMPRRLGQSPRRHQSFRRHDAGSRLSDSLARDQVRARGGFCRRVEGPFPACRDDPAARSAAGRPLQRRAAPIPLHHRAIRPAGSDLHHRQRPRRTLAGSGIPRRDRRSTSATATTIR